MKTTAVAALYVALMVCAHASGETVYRNGPEDARASNFFQPGQVHGTTGYFQEWGDEVTLAGTNRNITEMTVYYATDVLVPTGNARLRIRFYAVDGPPMGSPPRPSPGTLLWDSGSLSVYSGWRSQRFTVPDVIVPETFIWTAAFEGPDGNPGNRIGLYYFGPPSVGASDISVWQRSDPGEGWSYAEWDYSNGTTPYGSFGATLWANGGPEGIIFDTTASTGRTGAVMNPLEFGDDAAFEGSGRGVASFTFEYITDISGTPTGSESATVRFYSRDDMTPDGLPSTLLYESPPMPIDTSNGTHSMTVFPDVQVPDSIVWTVQWGGGLTQVSGNSAHLILKTGPSPGSSSISCWGRDSNGDFSAFWFGNPTFDPTTWPDTEWGYNNLVANLSARFETQASATIVEHSKALLDPGRSNGGSHYDLLASDDVYWKIAPVWGLMLGIDPIGIVLTHVLPGNAPAELSIHCESRGSAVNIRQVIEVWNHTTASWTILNTTILPFGGKPDLAKTVTVPNPLEHVGAGNTVIVRVRHMAMQSLPFPWTTRVDREFVMYTP